MRGYAQNAEGLAYGSSLAFQTSTLNIAPAWSDAVALESAEGWWSSPWFKSFMTDDNTGWLYHFSLGWVYAMPSTSDGVWLWVENIYWVWTDSTTYPFLFSNDWQSWLFYYGRSEDRLLFFRYSDNQWFIRDSSASE